MGYPLAKKQKGMAEERKNPKGQISFNLKDSLQVRIDTVNTMVKFSS